MAPAHAPVTLGGIYGPAYTLQVKSPLLNFLDATPSAAHQPTALSALIANPRLPMASGAAASHQQATSPGTRTGPRQARYMRMYVMLHVRGQSSLLCQRPRGGAYGCGQLLCGHTRLGRLRAG